MSILRRPRSLLVVLLLPLLVAGVGMWALKDRVDRLDTVPAAVVNLDEGTTMTIDSTEQFVPFGRQLAAGLTRPDAAASASAASAGAPATAGFDWRLTDEDDAEQGLRDGTYAAVIVIPADFSTKLATLGTPDPQKADIQVTTNDASGALDSAIGIAVSQAAASTTGSEMTRQYLSQLYVGFNTIQESFSQAADGAAGIDEGITGLDEGIGQTRDGARELSDGATGLAGGTRDLSDGAAQLDDGVQATADGTHDLADGLGQLADGTDSVAQGNRDLSDGLSQLADGTAGTAQGTRDLSDGLYQLADGGDDLADGARQLSDGINGRDGQPGLVTGVDQLQAAVDGDGTAANPGLIAGAEQLADGTRQASDGVRLAFEGDGTQSNPGLVAASGGFADGVEQYTGSVDDLAAGADAACSAFNTEEITADPRLGALCAPAQDGGAPPSLRAGLGQLAGDPGEQLRTGARGTADGITAVAYGSDGQPGLIEGMDQAASGAEQFARQAPALGDGVGQLSDGVHRLGDGASQLADGTEQLADGIRDSADGASQLADGTEQLADGVRDSADGASQLADGADGLSTGAHDAADGASQLADGTDLLADGSSQLADGTSQLADGADQLADGTTRLADGTDQLADGSAQLADGSGQFAQGLRDGADQMPTYSASERSAMSDMAAEPVTSIADRQNQADGAATATFPFVAALALWLGAFGSFLLVPALSRRLLDAAMPMSGVVLRSLLPTLAIGLVQAVAVLAVITAIGIRPVSALGVGVLTLAGAAAFAALHQALVVLLGGRVGRVASLVIMVLQVVALAGILPLQTAPPLLQSLSALMPITILSKGLTHAALGGALVSTSATLLALAAWGAGSVAVTLLASRNARSARGPRSPLEADPLAV